MKKNQRLDRAAPKNLQAADPEPDKALADVYAAEGWMIDPNGLTTPTPGTPSGGSVDPNG